MIGYKELITVINIVKRGGLRRTGKQVLEVFRKDGVRSLAAKIRKNQFILSKGVILFDKNRGLFFGKKFRYVYIKLYSDVACSMNLYWYAKNKLYETSVFSIKKGSAIYEFDLSLIKGKEHGQSANFQHGQIKNLGIRTSRNIDMKWSRVSYEKLLFKGDAPLIEMVQYPSVLQLEVTRRCNLRCYMCRDNRDEYVKEVGLRDLDLHIVERIAPFLEHAQHLALFGWGEPLCNPNFKNFIEMVGRIKKNNIENGRGNLPFTNFTTSGFLLNEDLMQAIIKNNIDQIVFSIDSPNKENYDFIRKGSEFNRVINNLRTLQALKNKYGTQSPAITIEVVAMRRNIEELPDMVRLAVDLNVKSIIVTSIVVATKGLEQESLYYHQELANKMFDLVEKMAKDSGIDITLPDRFGTKSSPQGYCNDPDNIFYVRAEGTVIPCCVATDAVIGDLNREDPVTIWKGDPREEFISNLRKGALKGQCKTCHKFTGNDINVRSTHIKV